MKKNRWFGILMISFLFPVLSYATQSIDRAKNEQILKQMHHVLIPFIENKGQIKNDDVKFYARTFGGTIFVEKNGILTYCLPAKEGKGVVIKEIFTDTPLKIDGYQQAAAKINYFTGHEEKEWRSDIPSYDIVSMGEIYQGIELSLKARGNNVEKIFTVLPNQNPEQIRTQISGCNDLKVNEFGELLVVTELGEVKFTRPVAFQEIDGKKRSVEVAYAIGQKNTYGFRLGGYDNQKPLIIDPLLASTFIGGYDEDNSLSIVLDNSGNVYVAGMAFSSDYPTTSGAHDRSVNGKQDVFISKFSNTLTTLLASTFIGGTGYDAAISVALGFDGNVFITGMTESPDYPTTSGAYDRSFNGNEDVFVSKLNSSLSALLASTFIGGESDDDGFEIALDDSGNAYVTGVTDSINYPTTIGAYDRNFNGEEDVFVSKLSNNLSALLGSTFIGGYDNEYSYSIALDYSGNAYITGQTHSPDYPTTSGAYDRSFNGANDVFISKLSSNLTTLLNSTFIGIGGELKSSRTAIALDNSGNVYIAGDTTSSDFPTTLGAYDRSFNGSRDAFISKLNSSPGIPGTVQSLYIGG